MTKGDSWIETRVKGSEDNRGNGRFREYSLAKGAGDFGTMGVACGDINNDGRIDLYVPDHRPVGGTSWAEVLGFVND